MTHHTIGSNKRDTFERTTRQIRWATIVAVLLTFPFDTPQAEFVYTLLLVAAGYNLLQHTNWVKKSHTTASPVLMMLVDTLFAGFLVALVGSISTPYSAFFVFMIVSAAYLYQMPGVLLMALGEGAIMYSVVSSPPFEPLVLDGVRTIALTIFALLAFGFMISRLTQNDRQEKRALEHLRQKSEQENSRLLTLVDSLNTGIIVTNSKGKILQHNEAARIMAGGEGDLDGKELAKVLPLYRRTDPKKTHVNIFNSSHSAQHRRDLSLTQEDGTQIDLDIVVTPVKIPGQSEEYILVCEDISKERSLEEQRTGFISVASHELRTPLAILEAALGSALLAKNEISPKLLPIIEQAHRSSLQLAEIVKDLAVLAEAQNDNLPVSLTQINADVMLTQCMNDFDAQAQQVGLTLKKVVDPHTPTVISAERHIREILQNYITNALKYTPEGTVTLKAEPAKNGGVLFSVEDQGIGIALGDQKLLFTKFFRAENYLTQRTGGTGLGLYLCMELAQRLGGRVWAKSVPGKGSTFFLEVPEQSHLRRDQGEVVKAEVANLVDGI
jgi:PAS domain S-box-containing protein